MDPQEPKTGEKVTVQFTPQQAAPATPVTGVGGQGDAVASQAPDTPTTLPVEQSQEVSQPQLQEENPLYVAESSAPSSVIPETATGGSSQVPAYDEQTPPQPSQPPLSQQQTAPSLAQQESTNSPFPTLAQDSGEGGRKFPLKPVIIGVLAVLLLGTFAFLANNLFFSKKTQQTKGPVELTYWGLWEDSATVGGLISEYEIQHKGVKINYVKQSKEDYRERLANSLAKGGPGTPDIFRLHNTWVPMLSSQLASLPPVVMDPATYQKTFYPVASQDLRRGADIVGMPLMFDGLGLYLNEGIFKSVGKSPPATWDELRKLALELTVRDGEGNISQAGVALGRTDNVDHWEDILALMMIQNGADLGNPTGKLAEDSLAFFTIFSQKDKVWDETLPPSTQAFAAGKLAMYFGPSWRAFEIKSKNPNLSFRVVPVPQLPKSNPSDPDITWASYWAEGVWSKSKYQKDAWEFLKFLVSKESLQKIYQAAAASRLFGPPYPIPEMAALLAEDPVVGAYVKQAPQARSWYLASRTFDGQTGINSRISAYFSDGVNAVLAGKSPKEALDTVAAGVRQVLANYQTK